MGADVLLGRFEHHPRHEDLSTASQGHDSLRRIVQGSLAGGYGVVCSKGYTVVLARGAPLGQLSDQMQQWLSGACTGRACLQDR